MAAHLNHLHQLSDMEPVTCSAELWQTKVKVAQDLHHLLMNNLLHHSIRFNILIPASNLLDLHQVRHRRPFLDISRDLL